MPQTKHKKSMLDWLLLAVAVMATCWIWIPLFLLCVVGLLLYLAFEILRVVLALIGLFWLFVDSRTDV